MVQYLYAKSSKNKIVNVKSLDRKRGIDKYSCIGCGNELIPRLGKIRKKHFAHKEEADCSQETYLHKLAKTVFLSIYKTCIEKKKPFFIEYKDKSFCNHFSKEFGVSCNLDDRISKYDLTSYFEKIDLEKRDKDLIPDIRIYNPQNNESIYIEIAVTHKSEETKKDSGNRIIEFSISDENDLKLFSKRNIAVNEKKISRFNFKNNKKTLLKCNGNCECVHKVFQVFKSGKSRLADITLKKLNQFVKNEEIVYYQIIEKHEYPSDSFSRLYVRKVINAHENGVPIKNCFLCKHHRKNYSRYSNNRDPIYCKCLRKTCKSNQAIECEFYRTNKWSYSKYKRN